MLVHQMLLSTFVALELQTTAFNQTFILSIKIQEDIRVQ